MRISNAVLVIAFVLLSIGSESIPGVADEGADDGMNTAREPLLITDLVADKDRWPEYVRGGTVFRVEGRTFFYTKFSFRMKGTELRFLPRGTETFPPMQDRHEQVYATGTLRVTDREGEYIFVVSHVEAAPTEYERFLSKRAEMDQTSPGAWFDLADWADRRAAFYGEPILAKSAHSARREGFLVQRSKLEPNDLPGHRRLAERAARLLPQDTVGGEILHDGYVKFARSQQDALANDLLFQLKQDLPGAAKPAGSLTEATRTAYEKDPLKTYREASETDRAKLERALYANLLRERIEEDIESGTISPRQIALRIERDLPEETALATKLKDGWVASKLENATDLTPDDRSALEDELRTMGRAETADRLRQDWLEVRLARWSEQGPDGLQRAAELVRQLNGDTQREVGYLRRALRLNPNLEEARRRMLDLGYRKDGGKWVQADEIRRAPNDELNLAIADGRVLPGMTAEQVQRSLGQPTTTARLATSGSTTLLWVFGDRSGLQTIVHFRLTDPMESSRVTQVTVRD